MKKIIILVLLVSTSLFGGIFDLESDQKKFQVRLLSGEGLYSSLGHILHGQIDQDKQDSGFIGVQLERYLERDIANEKIDFSLFGSLFLHTQKIEDPDAPYLEPMPLLGRNVWGYNVGVRAYWKWFPWNKWVRTKFSAAEGISYTSELIDLERQNVNKKTLTNYNRLLNYLEFNLHFNLGDILRVEDLEETHIGMGISHRSGIFGTFDGVHGGSNFIHVFIESEF